MEHKKLEFTVEETQQIRQSINSAVKEEMEKYQNKIKEELLRIEAHDARMTAYFLLKNNKFDWAVGWAVKSLKIYIQLYELKSSTNYPDLIEMLKDEIIKVVQKSGKVTKEQSGEIIRKTKDFYEAIVAYKNLKDKSNNYSKEDKEKQKTGIIAIENMLDEVLALFKKQLTNKKEPLTTIEITEMFNKIRFKDNAVYKEFLIFLKEPEDYIAISEFI